MTMVGDGTGYVGDLAGEFLFFGIEDGETFGTFFFMVVCAVTFDFEHGGEGIGEEDVFA